MVHFFPSMPEDMQKFIRKQPMFCIGTAPLNGRHVNVSPKGHPSRTFAILSPNRVAYLDWSGSSSEVISHIYENGRVTVLFNSFMAAPMIVRLYCTGSVIERDDPQFRPMLEAMHASGMERHDPNVKIRDTVQSELDRREEEAAERELNGGDASEQQEGDEGLKKSDKFRPRDVDMRPSDGAGVVGVRAIVVLDVWKCMRSCGFGVPLLMMGEDGELSEGGKGQVTASGKPVSLPPSPPATPKGDEDEVAMSRSQDVYDRTGVQFDQHWDDRTRMESWNAKMVVTGQLGKYRRKYNHMSLDGLPGIRLTCVDWQERLIMRLDAWARRTFVSQWRTLVLGMAIALILRRVIVHLWETAVA